MTHAIITFAIGVVIGGGFAWLLVIRRLVKRLAAAKAELAYDQRQRDLERQQQAEEWAKDRQVREQALADELETQTRQIQQLMYELELQTDQIQQLNNELDACEMNCDRLISNQERAQASLQKSKERYEATLKEKEREYASLLSAQRTENIQLQKAHSKHRENITVSLQTSQELEKQNTALSNKNKNLREKVKKLKETFAQQQQQYQAALKAASDEPDLDLNKIVEKLFPTVELLYHSVDELRLHKSDFGGVLFELQAIVNNGYPSHAKRIQGTPDKWWECRVGKQGRIYYLKINSEATEYKVVIAWKANKQAQNKVIDWLKKKHY